MTTSIIQHSFQDTPVFFQSDAFLNATAIAKKFNKRPADYLKSDSTISYLESITRILVIPENQLVKVKKGSSANGGGTWLHPKLAIDFARWLNPDFAVWCDMQIEKLLHPPRNALVDLPTHLPAKKQHIKNTVLAIARKNAEGYGAVYNRLFTALGIDKLANLKDRHYIPACKYLNVKPQLFEVELLPKPEEKQVQALPVYPALPLPEKRDYKTARDYLSNIKIWARETNNNGLVDDLKAVDRCLVSAWTEMDEALFRFEHGISFLKRWRNK